MISMEEVASKVKECQKCALHETRTNAVPGAGGVSKGVMFIGEAPGYWEDQKGIPFVGRAGKILDELLEDVGLSRDDVFITNILKCRPPKNRDPEKEEIKKCTHYLDRQIEVMQPKVLVALGRFSMDFLFEKYGLPKARISEVHGKAFSVQTLNGQIKLLALYHPAVATYNPNYKKTLLEDFKKLKELI